ncbi:hypothetical protein OAH18_02890 [bacterium]|nr:hypothetical protein [bacterium]
MTTPTPNRSPRNGFLKAVSVALALGTTAAFGLWCAIKPTPEFELQLPAHSAFHRSEFPIWGDWLVTSSIVRPFTPQQRMAQGIGGQHDDLLNELLREGLVTEQQFQELTGEYFVFRVLRFYHTTTGEAAKPWLIPLGARVSLHEDGQMMAIDRSRVGTFRFCFYDLTTQRTLEKECVAVAHTKTNSYSVHEWEIPSAFVVASAADDQSLKFQIIENSMDGSISTLRLNGRFGQVDKSEAPRLATADWAISHDGKMLAVAEAWNGADLLGKAGIKVYDTTTNKLLTTIEYPQTKPAAEGSKKSPPIVSNDWGASVISFSRDCKSLRYRLARRVEGANGTWMSQTAMNPAEQRFFQATGVHGAPHKPAFCYDFDQQASRLISLDEWWDPREPQPDDDSEVLSDMGIVMTDQHVSIAQKLYANYIYPQVKKIATKAPAFEPTAWHVWQEKNSPTTIPFARAGDQDMVLFHSQRVTIWSPGDTSPGSIDPIVVSVWKMPPVYIPLIWLLLFGVLAFVAVFHWMRRRVIVDG